jgi:hypothetical protein
MDINDLLTKISEEDLKDTLSQIEEFSANLTERTLLKQIQSKIAKDFPMDRQILFKILKLSIKHYRESNTVPLQKIALLEGEERYDAINVLKNSISTILFNILKPFLIKNKASDEDKETDEDNEEENNEEETPKIDENAINCYISESLNKFFKQYIEIF